MKRSLLLVFLAVLLAGWGPARSQHPAQAQTQAPASADPWARLNFLVGEWQGVGSGAAGEPTGGTTFAFDLGGKILVRKNWAKYPPKPGEKEGLSHEDLMIVYPGADGASFRAVYFDNEGHVIHYALSFPKTAGSVVLESEPGMPGPRFRLTYELGPDGVLQNVFLIAPPGKEFMPYVRGSLKKK